jgi:predicted transposase YbfD/YdcC
MASLLEVFEQIPDHRRAQAKQYPLPQVLLFCILGIMSGAISYRKLHSFIRIRFALLNRAFPSRMRKPPSYTQLREILVGLDKDDLEAAFRQHAGALANLTGEAAIAADAKALRGSFDAVDDRNAALVLSLFVAGERIILAHRAIDEKSNEIPALQALIAELGLQGKLFTADAEHCQKKTFAQTQACGSQLLVQVKDNQPSLATALAALPQTAAPLDVHETHDRIAHGRQENRRVEVFEAGPTLGLPEWERYALVGLRVSRVTHRKIAATGLWKTSREVSWYVTDLTGQSAAYYGTVIRGHWDVENPNHYVRDVALQEDASRIRKNPGIMARLRSFGLNILRLNGTKNVAAALFENALDPLRIISYAGL